MNTKNDVAGGYSLRTATEASLRKGQNPRAANMAGRAKKLTFAKAKLFIGGNTKEFIARDIGGAVGGGSCLCSRRCFNGFPQAKEYGYASHGVYIWRGRLHA